MKHSSLIKELPVLIYVSVLLTILLLPENVFPRPFDWYYSRFATPFAIFYNPALLGNNPGPTLGLDMRYADTTDYDARLAITVPLSRVLKREEHIRKNADKNGKYVYVNPSYMSSEASISFGGIYAGDKDYDLSVGFTSPVRMVQVGLSLCLAHRNEAITGKDIVNGTVNIGFCANVTRSGIAYFSINNINFYKLDNMLESGRNSSNDIGFSLGASGSPFSDTSRIFLPYDIVFTYTPRGEMVTIGRLSGMLRLNLDLTYIYTSRDVTGQMAVASLGYGFIRDEYRKVSHSIFASLGLEFVNKASSAALAGGYGAGGGRHSGDTHGAFMYSLVNKTGVGTDKDLVSSVDCSQADSGRVVFGLYAGDAHINSWVMKIETHGGGNIITFSGGNVIPSSIIWDGLSSEGDRLEDDIVYAKLVVRGENKVIESKTVSVEIVDGRPRPKRDL
jgi:hypothetical protein